jgi:4-amino-4-deoxy-L-arabinose transferase-like glycosyltransferase
MRDPAGQMISPVIPPVVVDRTTAGSSRREFLAAIGVAVLAGIVCFYHLGAYGLWEPDEARYAEIAREMIVLHDFLTPHLNYVPYIEKPPLLYWLTALAMRIVGINEFAARFTSASAAMIGIGAVYFFARRAFNPRQGILAAAILATSAFYALMAQVLTTDMLLAASLSVALFAFYCQWTSGGAWWWLMYVAIALGVLTKGPIAIIITTLVCGLFLLTESEWRGALRRFRVVPGLGIVGLIAAPWFVAIMIRQPDFFAFYFVGEHFKRFFDEGYSHDQPLYYYVPIMLGGTLPWALFVPFIPWRSLRPDPARRFCLIAAATIFVLFSMASAKLIPYILPAMPFVAIVIANGLDEFVAGRDCRRLAAVGPILGILAAGVLTVAACADRFASPNPAMVRPALQAAGPILLVAGVSCFVTFWRRRAVAGLATLALATAALLVVAGDGRLMAEPARSYAQLARLIAQRAPDARLICFPRYIQSLPFYTGRRVTLVGDPTELAYGAAHAADGPNYFFTRRADLLRLWNEPQPSLLIVDRGVMPALAKSLGTFTIIAEDHKKIAVMRTPGAAMERPRPGD